MATQFSRIYDAFLSRVTADDWMQEEDLSIIERDWRQLLAAGMFRFKYPRISQETDEENNCFINDLGEQEIHLLALYMKHEWIKRCVANWENIRQLYSYRDFSQGNYLNNLIKLEASIALEIHKAEGLYDRSVNKKPSPLFRKQAGKNV